MAASSWPIPGLHAYAKAIDWTLLIKMDVCRILFLPVELKIKRSDQLLQSDESAPQYL